MGIEPTGNGHLPSTRVINPRLSLRIPAKLNHGEMVLRHRIRQNRRELGSTSGLEPVYGIMRAAFRLGYVPNLAGVTGIEPASFGFGDRRSTVLNFTPIVKELQQKTLALGEGLCTTNALRPSYASSPNDPLPGHGYGSHGFGPDLHIQSLWC